LTRRKLLAADDLRNPLVAHVQDLCDVGHRQPVFVCLPDRLIAVGAQGLGRFSQLPLTPRVLIRKRGEVGASVGGLALRASDLTIVGLISANRLA